MHLWQLTWCVNRVTSSCSKEAYFVLTAKWWPQRDLDTVRCLLCMSQDTSAAADWGAGETVSDGVWKFSSQLTLPTQVSKVPSCCLSFFFYLHLFAHLAVMYACCKDDDTTHKGILTFDFSPVLILPVPMFLFLNSPLGDQLSQNVLDRSSWSLKGRCCGNPFLAQISENWHTPTVILCVDIPQQIGGSQHGYTH